MFNDAATHARDLQRSFQKLLHSYDTCMQRTLRKYGLFPGQPQILLCIRSVQGPTQNRIAAEMGLSRASVGVSLRRLERSGFVRRLRDSRDARCIRVVLTQKGQEYAHWCELDMEMIFTTMMENMTADERERSLNALGVMEQSLYGYNLRMEKKA